MDSILMAIQCRGLQMCSFFHTGPTIKFIITYRVCIRRMWNYVWGLPAITQNLWSVQSGRENMSAKWLPQLGVKCMKTAKERILWIKLGLSIFLSFSIYIFFSLDSNYKIAAMIFLPYFHVLIVCYSANWLLVSWLLLS